MSYRQLNELSAKVVATDPEAAAQVRMRLWEYMQERRKTSRWLVWLHDLQTSYPWLRPGWSKDQLTRWDAVCEQARVEATGET